MAGAVIFVFKVYLLIGLGILLPQWRAVLPPESRLTC